MSETRSTYRVYVKQWLFDSRHDTEVDALAYATKTYEERLAADEVQIKPDDLDGATWVVWTHRWSVAAELKYATGAELWSDAIKDDFGLVGENVKVIERNSRAEHELLQHGVLKVAG